MSDQYLELPFDPTIYPSLTPTQIKNLIEQAAPLTEGGLCWLSETPPDTSFVPRQRFFWVKPSDKILRYFNGASWEPVTLSASISDGSLSLVKLDVSAGAEGEVLGITSGVLGFLVVNDLVTSVALSKLVGGAANQVVGTDSLGNKTWLSAAALAALVTPNMTNQFGTRGVTNNFLHWTALPFGTATGTDTYVVNITPDLSPVFGDGVVTSAILWVKFTNANTGAATLKFNTLDAKPIKKNASEALVAGDILAGGIYALSWDGTNWQLQGTRSLKRSAILRHTATINTDGQAYVAGSPAAINLMSADSTDPDAIAPITGGTDFELQSGSYDIQAVVPFQVADAGVQRAQIQLYKIVGTTVVAWTSYQFGSDDDYHTISLFHQLDVASAGKYQLRFSCSVNATLGKPANLNALKEVYAQIHIKKTH